MRKIANDVDGCCGHLHQSPQASVAPHIETGSKKPHSLFAKCAGRKQVAAFDTTDSRLRHAQQLRDMRLLHPPPQTRGNKRGSQ